MFHYFSTTQIKDSLPCTCKILPFALSDCHHPVSSSLQYDKRIFHNGSTVKIISCTLLQSSEGIVLMCEKLFLFMPVFLPVGPSLQWSGVKRGKPLLA